MQSLSILASPWSSAVEAASAATAAGSADAAAGDATAGATSAAAGEAPVAGTISAAAGEGAGAAGAAAGGAAELDVAEGACDLGKTSMARSFCDNGKTPVAQYNSKVGRSHTAAILHRQLASVPMRCRVCSAGARCDLIVSLLFYLMYDTRPMGQALTNTSGERPMLNTTRGRYVFCLC